MQFWIALAIARLYASHAVAFVIHPSGSASVSLRKEDQFALLRDKLDAEDTFSAIRECTYIQFIEDLVSCDRIH